jgi:heparosan-N-sulfate-glucuronate 5-epimerase
MSVPHSRISSLRESRPTTAAKRRSRRRHGILAAGWTAVAALAALIVMHGFHRGLAPAARVLASLPTARYRASGPYAGPDVTNVDPPAIVLGPGGVPVARYPGVGYRANPVSVAQYGLDAYSRFVRGGGPSDERAAFRAANWLVAHQQAEGRWLYSFDFRLPGGSVSAPWASALAQGQAMSLLERAYVKSHRHRYLQAALDALAPLQQQVSTGGLQRCFRGDCRQPFFEEYPTRRPSEVLNGFMFTLLGLYDLASVAPRSDARRLYLAGRRTLSAALPDYDRDGVARYDLASAQVASQDYQAVHVYLLRALDSLGPNAEYRYYARRWEANLARAPA